MGAANVIPGVSGGTIAFITGIYEDLINGVKNFNLEAFRMLFRGEWNKFTYRVHFYLLLAVLIGVGASILSLARVLEYLLEEHPVLIQAYFFGLILASVFFVGKMISKWNAGAVVSFIIGTAIAVGIALLNPATENEGNLYLFICGIVAICSMILPGLSGSFILMLMGNYVLIIRSISEFNLSIFIPFGAGCIIGLIAFSHFLGWLFNKFRDITIAVLAGFILGSLYTIWPWKKPILDPALTDRHGDPLLKGYDRFFPESFEMQTTIALLLIVVGIISVWGIEKMAQKEEVEQ